jgi:hypothetical protein
MNWMMMSDVARECIRDFRVKVRRAVENKGVQTNPISGIDIVFMVKTSLG